MDENNDLEKEKENGDVNDIDKSWKPLNIINLKKLKSFDLLI